MGLDDLLPWPEPDTFDQQLETSPYLSYSPEVNRGPSDVANSDCHLRQMQGFSQQGSALTVASAQRLSPTEYADLFHNIRVDYFNPQTDMANSVTVNVHIYNNNGIDRRRGNMNEKGALVSALRRELRNADGLGLIGVERGHKVQIAHCFYGKGDPDEYRVTLMYALRYKRCTPGNLQRYCDRNAKLGLDCSGFVNSYFKHIGRVSESRLISTYERGTLRSDESEIGDLDVLIWQGGSTDHIAVVDHVIVGSNPLKMVVVESSGSKEGLATSEYTVHSVRNQIFRVHRGGPGRRTSRVKIVQV